MVLGEELFTPEVDLEGADSWRQLADPTPHSLAAGPPLRGDPGDTFLFLSQTRSSQGSFIASLPFAMHCRGCIWGKGWIRG